MPSLLPPTLVALHDLTLAAPDGRILLDHLDLAFTAERTGLVGRNGSGKSTLIACIAGRLTPRAGRIDRVGRIGLLRQGIDTAARERIADWLGVADALARLDRLAEGVGTLDDAAEADWTLPQRIEEALADVGLPPLDHRRFAATLSGGQRTRLALAALLIEKPDMILLDEPTDSLDGDGREAVARLLGQWKGGAIVASHDRALLRGMDRIVELSALGARSYGGGYDLYAERRAAERATAAERLDEAERALRATEARIQAASERKARSDARGRRERAKGDAPKMLLDAKRERAEGTAGGGARLAEKQREGAREALSEAEAAVERVTELGFRLPKTGLPARRLVLAMQGVSYGHLGAAPLFDNFDLVVTGPERIAVRGANGTGKSTLLKLIAGLLSPTEGVIERPVATAFLDQDLALLRRNETILDAFRRLNPEATINEAHAALARFLFRNQDAMRRIGTLSGGEALRAALAATLCGSKPPQLLILDEPSNHLDITSVAAVETALADFDGALIVASHDADFIAALKVTRTLDLDARKG